MKNIKETVKDRTEDQVLQKRIRERGSQVLRTYYKTKGN